MKKLPKGFAAPIILLIVGLILGAGAVFAYFQFNSTSSTSQQSTYKSGPTPSPVAASSPSVDETASWKTYTNANLGFSAKYPAGWPVPTEEYLNPQRINFKDKGGTEVIAVIRDEKDSPTYSLFSKLTIDKPEIETEFNFTRTRLTDIKIDGLTGIRVKEEPNAGSVVNYGYNISIKKGLGEYSIGVVSQTKADLDAKAKLADQIVSTFKFTK